MDADHPLEDLIGRTQPRGADAVYAAAVLAAAEDLEEMGAAPSHRHPALVAAIVIVVCAALTAIAWRGLSARSSTLWTETTATTAPAPVAPKLACTPMPTGRSGAAARTSGYLPHGVYWRADVPGLLRQHFGRRYGGLWLSSTHAPDGTGQQLIVAVVDPTQADQAWTATLPEVGGRVLVVRSAYDEVELEHVRDLIGERMERQPSGGGPRVTMVGIGTSGEDLTASARPAVAVGVSSCDPALLAGLARLAPAGAVDVFQMDPAMALDGGRALTTVTR